MEFLAKTSILVSNWPDVSRLLWTGLWVGTNWTIANRESYWFPNLTNQVETEYFKCIFYQCSENLLIIWFKSRTKNFNTLLNNSYSYLLYIEISSLVKSLCHNVILAPPIDSTSTVCSFLMDLVQLSVSSYRLPAFQLRCTIHWTTSWWWGQPRPWLKILLASHHFLTTRSVDHPGKI